VSTLGDLNERSRRPPTDKRLEERIREIRGSGFVTDEDFQDRFACPPPPDGWDYQWKRWTVYEKEDPAYQVQLAKQGWTPVPLSRHPQMMPTGWAGDNIRVEGLLLMERPAIFTEEARAHERRIAREVVRNKEQQLGLAPSGTFERNAKVSKRYEALDIEKEG
jgi:hypothetical protein